LNGDGVIDKEEFETTYREAEGVDPIYEKDLQLIDTNHDGQISRVELMVRQKTLWCSYSAY